MMVHKLANWKTLVLALISWVVGAVLILALSLGALSLLTTFVGKENFPSLTILVSVIGALIAISSFRTNAQEKKQSRARALAFASQMANETNKALGRPLASGYIGEVENAFVLDPSTIRKRKPHLYEMTKAVAAIDVKEMPSVEGMAALIELKSAMKALFDKLDGVADEPIDFDDDAARVMLSSIRLGKERDNLYPIYTIGSIWIKSDIERR